MVTSDAKAKFAGDTSESVSTQSTSHLFGGTDGSPLVLFAGGACLLALLGIMLYCLSGGRRRTSYKAPSSDEEGSSASESASRRRRSRQRRGRERRREKRRHRHETTSSSESSDCSARVSFAVLGMLFRSCKRYIWSITCRGPYRDAIRKCYSGIVQRSVTLSGLRSCSCR